MKMFNKKMMYVIASLVIMTLAIGGFLTDDIIGSMKNNGITIENDGIIFISNITIITDTSEIPPEVRHMAFNYVIEYKYSQENIIIKFLKILDDTKVIPPEYDPEGDKIIISHNKIHSGKSLVEEIQKQMATILQDIIATRFDRGPDNKEPTEMYKFTEFYQILQMSMEQIRNRQRLEFMYTPPDEMYKITKYKLNKKDIFSKEYNVIIKLMFSLFIISGLYILSPYKHIIISIILFVIIFVVSILFMVYIIRKSVTDRTTSIIYLTNIYLLLIIIKFICSDHINQKKLKKKY